MGRISNVKNYEDPRRFHVRYWNTKKLYNNISTFYHFTASILFVQGLKFIGDELEVWDSEKGIIVRSSKYDKD